MPFSVPAAKQAEGGLTGAWALATPCPAGLRPRPATRGHPPVRRGRRSRGQGRGSVLLFALRHLEDGALRWGILGSAFDVGLIIGAITALLPAPPRLGTLVCAGALAEATGTLKLVSYTSLQQREIPQDRLSRVIATASVAGSVPTPVFSALTGPLAGAVGERLVLAGCAGRPPAAAACRPPHTDVQEDDVEQQPQVLPDQLLIADVRHHTADELDCVSLPRGPGPARAPGRGIPRQRKGRPAAHRCPPSSCRRRG
ncbi:hypothetical protein GCM10023334_066760 [Nonomuraea thailandensis]